MKRRDVIRLAVLAATLPACGSATGPTFSCEDTSRLSEPERSARRLQDYTDQTTQPDRRCSNCRYYTPAPEGQCGACQLIRGPIHPEGYCNLWTARA
jgi:hypothetical protein